VFNVPRQFALQKKGEKGRRFVKKFFSGAQAPKWLFAALLLGGCSADVGDLFDDSGNTAGTGGTGGGECCPSTSSSSSTGGGTTTGTGSSSGTGGSCNDCNVGGGGAGGGSGGSGNTTSTGGGGGAGPICGDNVKDSGEVCDGSALDGKDCGSVPGGFTSGNLACASDCSAFDTSACVSPPPTCLSGMLGSPDDIDNITASGAIETGFYIRFADGTSYYSNSVPTQYTFQGKPLPAQLALYGKDGIQFDLNDDAAAVAMPYYTVSVLPSPECDGVGLKTQACLDRITKSFRCTHAPYNEAFGCPAPATFTSQGTDDFAQDLTAGHKMWLVDITCN
jgi:hypothetical protein